MKLNLNKWLSVVAQLAPIVLLAVPGGAALAPLVPVITHAITEAEQIKGASGADKKAHVLSTVQDAVAVANASGKVKLDPAAVQQVASQGVDAVIGAVNVVQGAKVVKTPTTDAPQG